MLYETTIELKFLSDVDLVGWTLSSIVYAALDDPSGDVVLAYSERTAREVEPAEMEELLLEAGSEPDYFEIPEESLLDGDEV